MLITPANFTTISKSPSLQPQPKIEKKTKPTAKPLSDAFEKRKKRKKQRIAIDTSIIVLVLASFRYSSLMSKLKFEKKMAKDFLNILQTKKVHANDFINTFEKERKNLAKHIEFNEAKTLKEAKEFAKQKLNIENFDVDDIEIANWLNKHLTQYNNMFEGKRILPNNVVYDSNLIKETTFAQMNTSLKHIHNSTLSVSKNGWENDEELINLMYENINLSRKLNNSPFGKFKNEFENNTTLDELEAVAEHITNMSQNPQNFTKPQKHTASSFCENINKKHDFLNDVENCKYYINYLKNKAEFSPEIKEIIENPDDYSIHFLQETAVEMMKICNYKPTFGIQAQGEGGSIFHELGHLAIREDEASSIYNFYKKDLSEINRFEDKINNSLEDFKKFKTKVLDFFGIKDSSIKYNFKYELPDHYETEKIVFTKDEKVTARMVSDYAEKNPEEFIAETFAALCERGIDKFSKDIIDLYKKLKGPLIDFFENKSNAA